MAFWYYASIRCPNEYVAKHMANKYHGQTFNFNAADNVMGVEAARMIAEAKQALDTSEWWVTVGCLEITDHCIQNAEEARKANEFDAIFYGMLRTDANFDYGIIQVEPDQFRCLKSLEDDFKEGILGKMDGLVISTKTLRLFIGEQALIPPEFVPFSPTHYWIPKLPEIPLK